MLFASLRILTQYLTICHAYHVLALSSAACFCLLPAAVRCLLPAASCLLPNVCPAPLIGVAFAQSNKDDVVEAEAGFLAIPRKLLADMMPSAYGGAYGSGAYGKSGGSGGSGAGNAGDSEDDEDDEVSQGGSLLQGLQRSCTHCGQLMAPRLAC